MSQPALIIIDVQEAFDIPVWGRRNNPFAERNISCLLQEWRKRKLPIFHVQHLVFKNMKSMFHPINQSSRFKEELLPLEGETIITKDVNSAFIGTNLEKVLREKGCQSVVITGLTTNHCVETTTRMAGNLGFTTYIVEDGTATFDRIGPDGTLYHAEDIHMMTLVNLHEEFATVVKVDEVLQMLKMNAF